MRGGGVGRRRRVIAFPDTFVSLRDLSAAGITPRRRRLISKPCRKRCMFPVCCFAAFRQSVQRQVWLHGRDKSKGYPHGADCDRALADFAKRCGQRSRCGSDGRLSPTSTALAETLFQTPYDCRRRHRSFDLLHVATALHLGTRDFLTFDANQRKLATAEKLRVKP